jgi:hypothetical protein
VRLYQVEVLDLMLAEVPEREIGDCRFVVVEKRLRRLRNEDLPSVRGGSDPGCAVDGHAPMALSRDRRLACVDSHAHLDGRVLGPLVRGKGPLRLDRRPHCIVCAREREEEAVPCRVYFPPSPCRKGAAHESVMRIEDVAEAIAELSR